MSSKKGGTGVSLELNALSFGELAGSESIQLDESPRDLAYQIVFPEPIVLHGSSIDGLIERALQYARIPGKMSVEPIPHGATKMRTGAI